MFVHEFMTQGCQCIKESETLQQAARMMRDMDVGALPICGDDDRLCGMLTDRDIVIKCIAEGRDASECTAGECAEGTPVWVAADADCSTALALMEEHAIKRLPVIEDHKLVGIVSQADIVTCLSHSEVGELVTQIAEAESNTATAVHA